MLLTFCPFRFSCANHPSGCSGIYCSNSLSITVFTASPVFSIIVYYFLVVTVYNLLGLNLLGLKLRCTLYFCISKIRMPLKMSMHLDIHDNMSKFNEVPVFPDLECGVSPLRPSCTHATHSSLEVGLLLLAATPNLGRGVAPKSLQMVIAAIKLKDAYFLEGKL